MNKINAILKRGTSYVMDTENRLQIQCKAVCISHSTITLWKGMYPTILPPTLLNGWEDCILLLWYGNVQGE